MRSWQWCFCNLLSQLHYIIQLLMFSVTVYLLHNELEETDATDGNNQNHEDQEAHCESRDDPSASSLCDRHHHKTNRCIGLLLSSQRCLHNQKILHHFTMCQTNTFHYVLDFNHGNDHSAIIPIQYFCLSILPSVILLTRVQTVHEKMDRTQNPILRPQFRPNHNLIRSTMVTHGLWAVVCKRHLIWLIVPQSVPKQ